MQCKWKEAGVRSNFSDCAEQKFFVVCIISLGLMYQVKLKIYDLINNMISKM